MRNHAAKKMMMGGAAASSLLTGLAAYWKLDEASGTRADVLGVSNLTDNNTVTQAAGVVGNSAQFTKANSEYLSCASNAALQGGDRDFEIDCWVYADTLAPFTTYMIFTKDEAVAGHREYFIYVDGVTKNFGFGVYRAVDSSVSLMASSFGAAIINTWYYIVAWHDAAADTINIQVNNGTVDSGATGGALQAASTAPLQLGSREAALHWSGRIDEAGKWNRVRTATERTTRYNGGSGNTYPF